MTKKITFEKPVFKHTRRDWLEAVYGGLSEDAARIAVEELLKKRKNVILKAMKEIREKDTCNFGNPLSCLLEVLYENSNSLEEFMIFCFMLVEKWGDFNSPMSKLTRMMKDVDTDR